MKILEYDEVDPFSALNVAMLALDFPFTPEHAARLRQTDPRPFPCLTVNAVEDNLVLGQVGVFRLPMISSEGREDVGGIWAVSTHPAYSGRGIASALLDEAHNRMRAAGLRFSTLGTDRSRVSHKLYQRQGYADMQVWATALARRETALHPARLSARNPTQDEGHAYIEKLFGELAIDYLGFAWRHTPFARLYDRVMLDDIWILSEGSVIAGYVFVRREDSMLLINIQLLRPDVYAAEAAAAVVAEVDLPYVRVIMSRPSDRDSLRRAGWLVAHPDWGAFMVKPLTPEVSLEDARRLFGLGTDRFLISWLDTT